MSFEFSPSILICGHGWKHVESIIIQSSLWKHLMMPLTATPLQICAIEVLSTVTRGPLQKPSLFSLFILSLMSTCHWAVSTVMNSSNVQRRPYVTQLGLTETFCELWYNGAQILTHHWLWIHCSTWHTALAGKVWRIPCPKYYTISVKIHGLVCLGILVTTENNSGA